MRHIFLELVHLVLRDLLREDLYVSTIVLLQLLLPRYHTGADVPAGRLLQNTELILRAGVLRHLSTVEFHTLCRPVVDNEKSILSLKKKEYILCRAAYDYAVVVICRIWSIDTFLPP